MANEFLWGLISSKDRASPTSMVRKGIHRGENVSHSLGQRLTPKEVECFQNTIYKHYEAHRRELPWRQTRNPYHILVSEIMLQQTKVERVVPKYREFLKTFPDLETLVRAVLPDVLTVWQGLGYNRRALALKRLAQQVMEDWDGRLPSTEKDLRTLPGIGPATAGALLAFAFEQPVVFIETNIRRVVLHFFFSGQEGVTDREILPLVAETLDQKQVRDWYYALMDYGANLKRRGPNPNRRSAHYARQAPFAGSNREVRSLILRKLLEKPVLSVNSLVKAVGKSQRRTERALEQLVAEGFVVRKGKQLHLALEI